MTMVDTDLLLMTLCIFLPSAFALVLLFFPRGTEEYMRWWTLFGTAVTFVISTFLFVDYLALLGRYPDPDASKANLTRPMAKTSLSGRAREAIDAANKNEAGKSDDMLGR